MAFALPFLLVFVVGLADFGGAYNLKQKISNAAREGARFGISATDLDTPSMAAVRNSVVNYLTNAGLTACNFTGTPSSGTLATFGSGTCILTINRADATVTSGGTTLVATKVTLTYPVYWTFDKIIGFLTRGPNPTLPTSLTSVAFMENIPQ
jgi:Flp pilus assembly protein TadG